ncbi:multidrug efflux protein NorA [Luminiphilus syltensis NOR5-1B]|uniref:Multidrug-efflux transporter n=1 Tax=Luminiphilus syltensis NOR5-1B TaxID=565045 RepID=B8KRA4_9GAMM|nr:MATE family efflux transporter [Luminiphilus syltensis]EED35633.1 multidrug efflux protein NorA [Luminiphilus syltensis NOR5-1B]
MSALTDIPLLRTELKYTWRIAWPLFVAQLAQMGTGVVDTIMAGHYNAGDLAAIAIGYNAWLPLLLFIVGVMVASAAIVAQDFGAGRIEKIRSLLPQSLWVAALLGLLSTPLAFFNEPVLGLLDLAADTETKASAYLRMVALGLPAAAVFQALRFHTQGVGITMPFAWSSAIGFVANIPLNYAFIYGEWGAPELGAEGCGIATALSMWLTLVLIVGYMLMSTRVAPYIPPLRWAPPDRAALGEILGLGIPIGLTLFLEVGVFSIIGLLVATLGDTVMASHQIAFNIWDVFYIPMLSIASAMSTRIGHAIGAGDKVGVNRALLVGSLVSLIIALGALLILVLVPEAIISIYTDSESIRTVAVRLIRLAAFFIVIDAVQIIMSFVLRAYKDTRFPFWAMLVSYWFIALPVGYWLGLVSATTPADGAAGFWYASILGITACAVLLLWRVWRLLHRPLPNPDTFEPEVMPGITEEMSH